MVAAWRLHCVVAETPKTHLEFRREIAVCPLKSSIDVRKKLLEVLLLTYRVILGMIQLTTSKSLQHKVDAKYTTRILIICVKKATSVFTQIRVRCVLRCIIRVYKSDSIQKSSISLYV